MIRIPTMLAALTAGLMTTLPAQALVQGPAQAQNADAALIERGAYLAKAGDCAACHREKKAGGQPYAGGYAIASPLGDIVAPNITPSRSAGIGSWSFADFDRAMRKGIRPDGARLYPAMPYTDYQGITDADMRALYAFFLHGVKPVEAPAPTTHLPFPFGIRALMIPWNWMFRSDKPFKAKPALSAQAQRGEYLVETLAHCGSCHTPRNVLMAEKASQAFTGGEAGGWHAPNITSDPVSGIGGWSNEQLVTYFRTGHVAGKGVAAGGMAEAVENSLRSMTPADLLAMAAYLRSVPAVRDPADAKPPFGYTQVRPVALAAYENSDTRDQAAVAGSDTTDGARLYAGACASCHGLNGAGTKDGFYPPLVGSSTTGAHDPANLIMTILNGVNREGADGHAFMPSFASQMTDPQIAAVANQVLSRFGNPATEVDAAQVATLRAGGGKPLLLKLIPWAFGLAALGLAGIAFLLLRRRKASRA
jgi:mono/diheme cytochrome c family protein